MLERGARPAVVALSGLRPERAARERSRGFSGWRADGILAGNGSNELIEALLVVTVGAGTRVVIPEPTFTLYALLTTILGGEPMRVRMLAPAEAESGAGARFRYDVEAIRDARRASGASLTIVCSPNNPTGTSLPLAEVERLCGDGDGLVVIDEAYHEFAGSVGRAAARAAPEPGRAAHVLEGDGAWRACASATCSPRRSSCAR